MFQDTGGKISFEKLKFSLFQTLPPSHSITQLKLIALVSEAYQPKTILMI